MKARKKILFLPAWYPSPESPAFAVFVREHARAAGLNDDVLVLVIEGSGQSFPLGIKVGESLEEGVRTLRIRHPGRATSPLWKPFRWLAYRRALDEIRRMGFRPDLIHAHVSDIARGAYWFSRRLGVPFILSEHSSDFGENRFTWFEKLRLGRFLTKASLLLPVSDTLQRDMISFGLKGPFQVVSNAVDTETFHPPSVAHQARPPILLSVGRLTKAKGVFVLLEALLWLRKNQSFSFQAWFLGDGPDRAAAEAAVVAWQLTEQVRFFGNVPSGLVAKKMREADLLVHLSFGETQGVVVLEALASCLPVVASRLPAMVESLEGGGGILVEPGDPVAAARAIRAVLEHPEQFDRERMRRRIIERHSLAAVGTELHRIYQEILETNAPFTMPKPG